MKIPSKTKKLYAVVINLGSLLHNEVYELNKGEYGFWDKTGDIGFNNQEKYTFGKNDMGGYVMFIFKDKKQAGIFLYGGLEVLRFMRNNWFKGF